LNEPAETSVPSQCCVPATSEHGAATPATTAALASCQRCRSNDSGTSVTVTNADRGASAGGDRDADLELHNRTAPGEEARGAATRGGTGGEEPSVILTSADRCAAAGGDRDADLELHNRAAPGQDARGATIRGGTGGEEAGENSAGFEHAVVLQSDGANECLPGHACRVACVPVSALAAS